VIIDLPAVDKPLLTVENQSRKNAYFLFGEGKFRSRKGDRDRGYVGGKTSAVTQRTILRPVPIEAVIVLNAFVGRDLNFIADVTDGFCQKRVHKTALKWRGNERAEKTCMQDSVTGDPMSRGEAKVCRADRFKG